MTYTTFDVDSKIKERIEALRSEKRNCTYDQLVSKYGVNRKELCRLITWEEYDPPAWVWAQLGVPVYELARVCEIHGKACTLNCAAEKVVPINARVVVPHGTARRRTVRATIYPGTPVDKIRHDLEIVTGKRFVCLETE